MSHMVFGELRTREPRNRYGLEKIGKTGLGLPFTGEPTFFDLVQRARFPMLERKGDAYAPP